MEENLEENNEVNKEISDNTTKSNSEEFKGPKSEKVINMDTNNTQKTSFRYFKWTVQEISIGKLISISFFSGLLVSTLLNTTITSTSFRKKTFENVEDDFVNIDNEEEMEPNVEMPPQRDIRETQPTISVNYRVVKNMNDNNSKKDQSYTNQDINDDWDNADNDW